MLLIPQSIEFAFCALRCLALPTTFVQKMRRTVLLVLSLLAAAPTASGFAPSMFNGATLQPVQSGGYAAVSTRATRTRLLAPRLAPQMMLDPTHADAFILHAPLLGDSLQHASSHVVSAVGDMHTQTQSLFELAAAKVSPVSDSASLSPADATLNKMINAVDIGEGSETIQRILITLVNTPGIRQILQVVLPPASFVAAGVSVWGLVLLTLSRLVMISY